MSGSNTALESLLHRVQLLEAKNGIESLQHQYGYYLDKCLYNEVVQLFADDADVIFHGSIWKGKEGIDRLYIGRFQKNFTGGRNGPVAGFLLDHIQAQPVITIGDDLLTAQARYRTQMFAGRHQDYAAEGTFSSRSQWFEGGIYENIYKRESLDAPWKIAKLDYHPLWHGTVDDGWAKAPANYVPFDSVLYPENPVGPDAFTEERWLWPDTRVVPFHYTHPVTGKHVAPEDHAAPAFTPVKRS